MLQDILFRDTFDEHLKSGLRAAKAPVDCLQVDNPLGEKFTELKNLLRQESESVRAAAAADTAAAAETEQEGVSPLKDRSPAFLAFLDNVQAKMGEIKNNDILELIATYEEKARNLFASNVTLSEIPNSETEFAKILQGSAAAAVRGSGPAWTAVILDPAQWGEAITSPNIRTPPLNLVLLKQFMNAVIQNRDKQSLQLQDRNMVVYFDCFTPGNTSKVLSSLQNSAGSQISKNVMNVYLSYDEDSLRNRRQYVKHNSTIFQQVEVMSIVTHDAFQDSMTYRARLYYKGSNLGNKIGDVALDAPATLWSLQLKAERRQISEFSKLKPMFPKKPCFVSFYAAIFTPTP